jgi:hypothetical protein
MIRPCPVCGESSTNYDRVAVEEVDPEAFVGVEETPTLSPSDAATFETTECIRFSECGHAFERESVQAVLDELREYRELCREVKQTTDAGRMRELKEYELPAQANAVKEARRNVVRREEAEEVPDACR